MSTKLVSPQLRPTPLPRPDSIKRLNLIQYLGQEGAIISAKVEFGQRRCYVNLMQIANCVAPVYQHDSVAAGDATENLMDNDWPHAVCTI